MSLTTPVIAELVRAGLAGDDLVAACERIERACKAKARSNAERQAAWREREKAKRNDSNVTPVTDTLPSPDGPPPQTPPPLNPQSCPAAATEQQAGQGKIDYDEVQTWASSLVGTNPVAVNLDISPVISLLRAGFSRERVEIGIRAACSAARQPIKSWKTFDGWVKNTAAEAAPIAKPKTADDSERYRAMAQSWERGTWSDFWGPEPGQPGCRVPVEYLPTQSPTGKEAA